MRTYILTSYERKLIENYLVDGRKFESLCTLLRRCRKHKDDLEKDLAIITGVLILEANRKTSETIELRKKTQDEIIQQLLFDVSYLKVMVDLIRIDIDEIIKKIGEKIND